MAVLVIDLVSSSPSSSGTTPAITLATGDLPARPRSPTSNFESAGQRQRPAADNTRQLGEAQAEVLYPPDDDADDLDSFDAADPRRKWRRASPLSPAKATALIRTFRPPLLAGRDALLTRSTLDPIEVSSSMEQMFPKDRPPGASQESPPGSPDSPVGHIASIDLDPFASSPEPAISPEEYSGQPFRRAVSLDPFFESPSRAAGSPLKLSTSRRSYSRTAGASAAHSCTLDLSDDRHTSVSRTSESATRPFEPQIINIEDSDSLDGSDDSDFPDIMDMDVPSRPLKPRSPLRRSRSETIPLKTRSNTSAARLGGKRKADGETRAAAKAAEQERKRREREQVKDARVREKQRAAALAEVNKLRTDKKLSTPEMIVDLPSSLASEHRVQLEVLLEGLGVEHTTWETPDQSIVKWRRKVTSRFDENLSRWEPIPPRIQDEKHALAILTAEDFVGLILKHQLEAHTKKIREKFGSHDIIYLLQGMAPWMRNNRNMRNRRFTSSVRANQAPSNPDRGPQNNHSSNTEYIPEDGIEDALLRLQVDHDVFIHHTTIAAETAKWVATFTQHISTIPYRKQKDHATSAAGFCMESGQVRTGEDPKDTYVKMLQEIFRITAPVAYGVATEFDSVSKLVKGLEDGGPDRLDGVRKSANRDGQPSDRSVGQAVSRRLYRVFTGRDEGSTDV